MTEYAWAAHAQTLSDKALTVIVNGEAGADEPLVSAARHEIVARAVRDDRRGRTGRGRQAGAGDPRRRARGSLHRMGEESVRSKRLDEALNHLESARAEVSRARRALVIGSMFRADLTAVTDVAAALDRLIEKLS